MTMTENQALQSVLDTFEGETPEALIEIWKAAKVDFEDFRERPNDFRDPSSGAVTGLIYYDDTKPLGKKWLHVAIVEANALDFELKDFLFKYTEDEVDFNFVCWFLYELLVVRLIDFVEERTEEEFEDPFEEEFEDPFEPK